MRGRKSILKRVHREDRTIPIFATKPVELLPDPRGGSLREYAVSCGLDPAELESWGLMGLSCPCGVELDWERPIPECPRRADCTIDSALRYPGAFEIFCREERAMDLFEAEVREKFGARVMRIV